MAEIYVLLVRTNSIFSRFIHIVTKAKYTHASISFDPACLETYSFARKHDRLPLPAGFVRESVIKGMLAKSRKAPFALYRAQISEEDLAELQSRFEEMLSAGKFRYSLTGPFFCFFGRQREKSYHYFCSQFVAEILQQCGAIEQSKPASLFQPVDFTRIKELELCCQGELSELQHQSRRLSVQM